MQEDNWNTSMGLVFPGERVVIRGKDLFHELHDMRWMDFFLFGITGRRFDDKQIRLFEGMWVLCTSYPDPRIWNNRIAALAGTARSTSALGVSAAISISEAQIYGFKPIVGAYDFLVQTNQRISSGEDLEHIIITEIKRLRVIPGYARPFGDADERVIPLLDLADRLGLSNGEHTRLAFEIDEFFRSRRYRLRINIAALAAALAADQGLSSFEYNQYVLPCFIGGMVPCYIDTHNRPEGSFLPLSCHRISYEGKPNRKW
jgi:hypothetical protein